MGDELTDQITRARAEVDVDRATALESEHERHLAKNASDTELERRGYNPDDLRKAHRSQAKREAGGKKKDSGSASASATRDELEARAGDLGIGNPDDREKFPNKDALADAIAEKE